jgi:NTP pyrophosphatase (non-canonical NTP hydrolase)
MDNETKEILCITQEECAEVSQAISKIFRFGPDQVKFDLDKTNREHLEEEIGDLLCMIDILIQKTILSDWNINEARINKLEKLKQWSNIKIEST